MILVAFASLEIICCLFITKYYSSIEQMGERRRGKKVKKGCKKMVCFSLIERVILSAGAMLIFSVSFQIDQMPEGESSCAIWPYIPLFCRRYPGSGVPSPAWLRYQPPPTGRLPHSGQLDYRVPVSNSAPSPFILSLETPVVVFPGDDKRLARSKRAAGLLDVNWPAWPVSALGVLTGRIKIRIILACLTPADTPQPTPAKHHKGRLWTRMGHATRSYPRPVWRHSSLV
ncbi:hypothetical protein GGR52DRAFT_463544 [Hypoxylon sp. FL1284]|nr:hypothetical protein GGR52DRAFT_463544 [Hypoxylon sp. FL1284]